MRVKRQTVYGVYVYVVLKICGDDGGMHTT